VQLSGTVGLALGWRSPHAPRVRNSSSLGVTEWHIPRLERTAGSGRQLDDLSDAELDAAVDEDLYERGRPSVSARAHRRSSPPFGEGGHARRLPGARPGASFVAVSRESWLPCISRRAQDLPPSVACGRHETSATVRSGAGVGQ
jgi:hypothetical protein